MKVFVIGGVTSPDPDEEKALAKFCGNLGRLLGESEHQIVLCSSHRSSADRAVLEGLKDSPGRKTERKLIVHRPDDAEIRKEWQTIKKDIGIVKPEFRDHQGPEFRAKDGKEIASMEGLRLAFL